MSRIRTFLSLIIFSLLPLLSYSQWEWSNPKITPKALTDITFNTDTSGFAIGEQGIVLKTVDSGQTWAPVDIGMTYEGFSVSFSTTLRGFITTYGGYYETLDGGDTWYFHSVSQIGRCYEIVFLSPQKGFMVGYDINLMLRTDDGGDNWYPAALPPPGSYPALNAIDFVNDQVGYAVGGISLIYKTTDGGNTWTKLDWQGGGQLYFRDVHFFDAYSGVMAWENGILKTIDGGVTWSFVYTAPGMTSTVTDLDFQDASTGYASGPWGLILKTTSGGNSWTALELPSDNGFPAICNNSAGHLFICGSWGTIMESTDEGVTWDFKTTITDADFYCAVYSEPGKVFICGDKGTILRSTDQGLTWQKMNSNTIYPVLSLSFPTPGIGYAVGAAGMILKSTDGGENWNYLVLDTGYYLKSVFFTDPLTGYAVGSDSIIKKTVDGGVTWITQPAGISGYYAFDLYDVFFPVPDTGYICGEGGVLLKTTNGGDEWYMPCLGLGSSYATSIWFLDTQNGFATTNDALEVHHTTDGGYTWVQQGSNFNEWNDVQFSDPLNGHVCGFYGQICRTTDGGQTWNTTQIDDWGAFLDAIRFQDADTGIVVGDGGVILRTTNGGVVTGSENIKPENSINIFPNPTTGQFKISLPAENSDRTLEIFNMTGSRVYSSILPAGRSTISIHLNDLPAALYLVRINSSGRILQSKFLLTTQ